MMQWFVNEVRERFSAVDKTVEGWAKKQVEDAERITKLEGEIKAMKARAGKQKD
jgi:chaperonin cofactor prefoldin